MLESPASTHRPVLYNSDRVTPTVVGDVIFIGSCKDGNGRKFAKKVNLELIHWRGLVAADVYGGTFLLVWLGLA